MIGAVGLLRLGGRSSNAKRSLVIPYYCHRQNANPQDDVHVRQAQQR